MNQISNTNLVIDIGNTRTKTALFQDGGMAWKKVYDSFSEATCRDLAYNHRVKNIILSSTAKVPGGIEEFLRKEFFYLRLTHETPLPIKIEYGTPGTLGRDRIAAAAGAWVLFPKENVLIIDAGTCITLDVLDKAGTFLGGNISPGIGMRLKAMHHFTANLPLAEAVHVRSEKGALRIPTGNWIGGSTESAVRNGGELGALLEIKAFITHCRRRFRPLKVVFTGGDADFFVKNLKTKIFAHQNLVLEGLNQILQLNVNQSEGI